MLQQIQNEFKNDSLQFVSVGDPHWTPTHEYNKKVFMRGRLRGYDPQKSLLSNMCPSSLVIMLTSTAIDVEWEGLLVDQDQNDLLIGSKPEVRYNLAIFRDV